MDLRGFNSLHNSINHHKDIVMAKEKREGKGKEPSSESKERKSTQAYENKAGKKISDNVSQMPAGTPQTPGPINDPSNHPVDNIPNATDPRWAEELQAMAAAGGAQGGM